MDSILLQLAIYLTAGVVAVPISQRLGFGSVLGYLAAGIAIGPGLKLVGRETALVQDYAEYGVVLMLFLIGLEMNPRSLWDLRHRLLGLGGMQLALTIPLLAAAGLALGLPWNQAVVAGMALALSSTAIVMQTLSEKHLAASEGGRASIAVLLFQDVAAVPLLALIPLLALGPGAVPAGGPESMLHGLSPLAGVAVIVAAVALVILAGRYLTQPVFRFLGLARLPEVHIAGALLLVVAISLMMDALGLSPALGSFLAGVVLGGSAYRHELEADLAPFKGLLMGLFFITVGAGIDLHRAAETPLQVALLVLGLIALKTVVLWSIARAFCLPPQASLLFTLALPQGGEFGFVLVSFAEATRILPPDIAATLLLLIAGSMVLTPGLFQLRDILARRLVHRGERLPEPVADPGTVIVAGMGRFGQTVTRILSGLGHRTVLLDRHPATVERMRALGIPAYLGAADRPEVLAAAGIASARAIVIAIDDPDQALRIVRLVRRRAPHVRIIARARDRHAVYRMTAAGADVCVREIFDSAVRAGGHALAALGHDAREVEGLLRAFAAEDTAMIEELAGLWRPDLPAAENAAFVRREREQLAAIEAKLRRPADPEPVAPGPPAH
ncbi:MAG TPA: cation:proton antiporter [Amaricoccus sp.]|nr:cation:proton antiporter [Amaricoccus sp.]